MEWQYHGLAYDGDADGQLEVLVCAAMTNFGGSSWYPYTCEPATSCNIVAHPCCLAGECLTNDNSAAGVERERGRVWCACRGAAEVWVYYYAVGTLLRSGQRAAPAWRSELVQMVYSAMRQH